MDERGIAARIHDLPAVRRRSVIALLLLAMVGLAWWGLSAPTADLPIALWWPAAAFGVAAVLASRGRGIGISLLMLALIAILNVAAGRPPGLAIGYGIANAAESWVVAWWLTRHRPFPRLVTLPEGGKALVAAGLGAGVIAVLGGIAAAVFVEADPLSVIPSLFTSHASALFAIVPLFLVPLTVRLRAPAWEPAVQSVALVVLTFVVFAPAAALALTFFIITTLMWGAFRLPPPRPGGADDHARVRRDNRDGAERRPVRRTRRSRLPQRDHRPAAVHHDPRRCGHLRGRSGARLERHNRCSRRPGARRAAGR